MRTFEFHAYKGDEHGVVAERAEVTVESFAETAHAKAYAGRLSKKVNGPVDVARWESVSDHDWHDRYITTASPSEYHVTGYRFERLT